MNSFDVFFYTFNGNELTEYVARMEKPKAKGSLVRIISYKPNDEIKKIKSFNIPGMVFGAGEYLWLYSSNKKLAAMAFKSDIENDIAELNAEIKKKNASIRSLETFIEGV